MYQARNPGAFNGTGTPDVEDWISMHERVSLHNHWDPTIMLANVICYLNDIPRVCFKTHADEPTSWDLCKTRHRELFEKPVGRKCFYQSQLVPPTQTPTVSYLAHIQDIPALRQKVDATMANKIKVGHILKRIADDTFQLLVIRDCLAAVDIITVCR